jgi:hypothetical protein
LGQECGGGMGPQPGGGGGSEGAPPRKAARPGENFRVRMRWRRGASRVKAGSLPAGGGSNVPRPAGCGGARNRAGGAFVEAPLTTRPGARGADTGQGVCRQGQPVLTALAARGGARSYARTRRIVGAQTEQGRGCMEVRVARARAGPPAGSCRAGALGGGAWRGHGRRGAAAPGGGPAWRASGRRGIDGTPPFCAGGRDARRRPSCSACVSPGHGWRCVCDGAPRGVVGLQPRRVRGGAPGAGRAALGGPRGSRAGHGGGGRAAPRPRARQGGSRGEGKEAGIGRCLRKVRAMERMRMGAYGS